MATSLLKQSSAGVRVPPALGQPFRPRAGSKLLPDPCRSATVTPDPIGLWILAKRLCGTQQRSRTQETELARTAETPHLPGAFPSIAGNELRKPNGSAAVMRSELNPPHFSVSARGVSDNLKSPLWRLL